MRGQFKYNKNMDNLEQIKKAVEIEVKYKYININGRMRSFSSFICSELRKEIKKSKNPKWQVLLVSNGYFTSEKKILGETCQCN